MVRSFSQFHLKTFVCTAMAVHRARGNSHVLLVKRFPQPL